jgi:hypothetical protein
VRFVAPPCPACNGSGYERFLDHGCDGNVNYCELTCPVENARWCQTCEGTGQEPYLPKQVDEVFTVF